MLQAAVRLKALQAVVSSMFGTGWPLRKTQLFCGRSRELGIDNVRDWQDYTFRETTIDQGRIEDVIENEGLGRGGAALHVGIGNSGLACRFRAFFSFIDGITIQEGELAVARALGLANYAVHHLNKYDPDLVLELPQRYDVIIDNNPNSFGCCRYHFFCMIASYAALLKTDGSLLSDEVGLWWTPPTNDLAWTLTCDEWFFLGRWFGLTCMRFGKFVVGLRKVSS